MISRITNTLKSSWGYIYVFCFVRIFFFNILIKIGLDPQSSWGWQVTGFPIKDFGNDKSVVIPHLMRNPGSIYSSNINKEKIGSLFGSKKTKKKINTGFPLSLWMTNTTSQPVGVYFKYGLQGSHFHYTYKNWSGSPIKLGMTSYWIPDKRFREWQKCCNFALDAESRKYLFFKY